MKNLCAHSEPDTTSELPVQANGGKLGARCQDYKVRIELVYFRPCLKKATASDLIIEALFATVCCPDLKGKYVWEGERNPSVKIQASSAGEI